MLQYTSTARLFDIGLMKLWPNLVASLCILLFGELAVPAHAAENKEITSVFELNHLQPAENPTPLRLKGIIVCYDAGWHQLYLHDGEHTTYFNADVFKTQPEPGQEVQITGFASASNAFTELSLNVLGRKPLPKAIPLRLQDLAREHSEWIETSGRVLSADTSRGRLALVINDQHQNGLLYVLGGPVTNNFNALLGAQVRLRGINASKSAGDRLETAMIFVPAF